MSMTAFRVQEVSTAGFAGTGDVQLDGVPSSPTGRQTFSAGVGNGETVEFLIDDGAGNWEISRGVIDDTGSPHTVSRDTVLRSSTGAKVNFSAGVKDVVAIDVPALPKNYIAGLRLSNDTDAAHDIAIAVGECRDYDDGADMALVATLTKQIDAAWSVGDDAGGLDTGAVAADTLYGVWLIRRSDTGVVDAMFSTDVDAATTPSNLPTNYDEFRLIGAVVTDGSSNIIAFIQSGDYFRLTGDVVQDITDATITDGVFETAALSVPPKCLAHIYASSANSTATDTNGYIAVRYPSAADAGTQEYFMHSSFGGTTFDQVTKEGFCLVDASSQVDYATKEASGSATAYINTIGFQMLTRSDP